MKALKYPPGYAVMDLMDIMLVSFIISLTIRSICKAEKLICQKNCQIDKGENRKLVYIFNRCA